MITDTETTTLINSLRENAQRLGLTWALRYGTAQNNGQVLMDGTDTKPIDVISFVGPLVSGMRCVVMSVPPSGQYVTHVFPDTWHPFVFQNSWHNNISTEVPAQYKLVRSLNSVFLVGEIVAGTIADGTVIAQLPAGYRPIHTVSVPVATNPNLTTAGSLGPLIQLLPTGNIVIFGIKAAGTAVYFSALFPLDA